MIFEAERVSICYEGYNKQIDHNYLTMMLVVTRTNERNSKAPL